MKLLFLGMLLSVSAAASDQVSAPPPAPQSKPLQIDWKAKPAQAARCGLKVKGGAAGQGCCSYHGGVCGCDTATGKARCCDGQDSPSCGCD